MHRLLLPPNAWLAALALMVCAHAWFPLLHVEPSAWRTGVGLTLQIVALGVTIWHARRFRSAGSSSIKTFDAPDSLEDAGLFRSLRNPIHLAFVVALAGLALILGALSPWLVLLGFFLLADRWYMPFEERTLEEGFGAPLEDEVSHTRRWG